MRAALPGVTAFLLLMIVAIYLALLQLNSWIASGAAAVAGVAAIFIATRLPREALFWERGAKGERKTSDALAPLQRRDFIVLHDRRIPDGRSNIDHVAIGPQGVFVIETKYLSGDIQIINNKLFIADTERHNIVEQVYREAIATQIALGDALNRLRLTVTPILCIHGARIPWLDKRVGGIALYSAREVRHIADGPKVLGPDQIQQLAQLADRQLRPMY